MHHFPALADFFRNFRQPVVLLDLETTGGHHIQDRITEIAFLHISNGRITPVQHLVNPQIPISPFIENLTGISNDMVAQAPTFAQLLPQLLPLLRGSLIIAHNSRFDYNFLRHECQRAGAPFAASALCSVQLSRKLYPAHHKHSLDALIERHGIPTESRHRAMSDVLALAAFLQTALHEHGPQLWLQHARQLAQPALPPDTLPVGLTATITQLSDSHGLTVWYQADGRIHALHSHEHAYRETVLLLHRNPPPARLDFIPTIGPLHTQAERIRLMAQHQLLPPHTTVSGRHTIRFQTDPVSGCLTARIRPLTAGFAPQPPTGLFAHPKAAKRALNDWAKQHHICPTLLGILPDPLPAGSPCPVSLVGHCSPACRQHNSERHNQSVTAALSQLPVCDWRGPPRTRLTETDPISGRSLEFLCDSGALWLPDYGWYSDAALLAVLKHTFKNRSKAA